MNEVKPYHPNVITDTCAPIVPTKLTLVPDEFSVVPECLRLTGGAHRRWCPCQRLQWTRIHKVFSLVFYTLFHGQCRKLRGECSNVPPPKFYIIITHKFTKYQTPGYQGLKPQDLYFIRLIHRSETILWWRQEGQPGCAPQNTLPGLLLGIEFPTPIQMVIARIELLDPLIPLLPLVLVGPS